MAYNLGFICVNVDSDSLSLISSDSSDQPNPTVINPLVDPVPKSNPYSNPYTLTPFLWTLTNQLVHSNPEPLP